LTHLTTNGDSSYLERNLEEYWRGLESHIARLIIPPTAHPLLQWLLILACVSFEKGNSQAKTTFCCLLEGYPPERKKERSSNDDWIEDLGGYGRDIARV